MDVEKEVTQKQTLGLSRCLQCLHNRGEGSHLCTDAPVEPAHIGRVSEVGVDSGGDEHVALGLLVLHNVVEVGTCC